MPSPCPRAAARSSAPSGSPAAGGARGSLFLVTDSGVLFGIRDEDAAKQPRADRHPPQPAPWPVLAALPRGPELSQSGASVAVTASSRRRSAARPPRSATIPRSPRRHRSRLPEPPSCGARGRPDRGRTAGPRDAGRMSSGPTVAGADRSPRPVRRPRRARPSGSQPAAGRCAVSSMRCMTWRAVSCGDAGPDQGRDAAHHGCGVAGSRDRRRPPTDGPCRPDRRHRCEGDDRLARRRDIHPRAGQAELRRRRRRGRPNRR